MVIADQPGPFERVWRAHFATLDDPALSEARYIPPTDCNGPLLLCPAEDSAARREEAFGYAICRVWLGRLGERALCEALGQYSTVAAAVERELSQPAAD